MDIPGVGEVHGQWDLRGREDEYLGHVNVAGRRVLEIGPASGFITLTLDRRGAEVVAVDTAPDAPWDFVPQQKLNPAVIEQRSTHMERLRNSWWFVHEQCALRARVHYGHAERLPDDLGRFDVAVVASVLLHCRNPLSVIQAAAERSKAVVITDMASPDLSGAVCRLVPSRENAVWDTWWTLTPELVEQFLGVLGFGTATVTHHTHEFAGGGTHPFFTVVAHR